MAALAFVSAGPASAAPVKAKVESGVLAGDAGDGVAVFRGVPFAAAPVGPLRWKPPSPVKPWSGERPAKTNGAACLQPEVSFGGVKLAGEGGISEDCLYLNV